MLLYLPCGSSGMLHGRSMQCLSITFPATSAFQWQHTFIQTDSRRLALLHQTQHLLMLAFCACWQQPLHWW